MTKCGYNNYIEQLSTDKIKRENSYNKLNNWFTKIPWRNICKL